MRFVQGALGRLSIAAELIKFLWVSKMWWLIPLAVVLLFFGLLAVAGTATGVGPFIYTLF